MRLILSLSLAFISLSVVAQNPFSPDFPFPYNPDGNADGYIGLNDMLDLLSVYGQQYPESFYGDSTGAILFIGKETAGGCLRASELAGSKWRVMTPLDALKRDIVIANHFSESYNQEPTAYFDFWVKDTDGDFIIGTHQFRNPYYAWINTQDGGEGYPDGLSYGSGIQSTNYSGVDNSERMNYWQPEECILVTEVYPEIEYHIIEGNLEEVQSAVNDSLSNGWKLQGGIGANGQAIWKYTE